MIWNSFLICINLHLTYIIIKINFFPPDFACTWSQFSREAGELTSSHSEWSSVWTCPDQVSGTTSICSRITGTDGQDGQLRKVVGARQRVLGRGGWDLNLWSTAGRESPRDGSSRRWGRHRAWYHYIVSCYSSVGILGNINHWCT